MSAKLDALREALAVSPQNAPLLLVFAQACLEEWLLDDARVAFEQLLALDPASVEAKLGLARVLHLAGRSSEAAVRLESLLQAHERCAPAHVLLARLELIDGNRESARTHYERALALDPLAKDAGLESELYRGGARPGEEEPRKVAVGAGAWEQNEQEEQDEG